MYHSRATGSDRHAATTEFGLDTNFALSFPEWLMKIRFLLSILAFAAPTAGATTFNLPKNAPLFSIEMPDDWVTEEKGDVIISRPEKDSEVNYSVTVIPGAKNLEDALASVEKSVRAAYQEVSIDKASQEKEAGMDFLSAGGNGKEGWRRLQGCLGRI